MGKEIFKYEQSVDFPSRLKIHQNKEENETAPLTPTIPLEFENRLNQILIPEELIEKWQKIVDLIADILKVPECMVTRFFRDDIEIITTHNSPAPLFKAGERFQKLDKFYCEIAVQKRKLLMVPNALKDPFWEGNPDLDLNLIAYLGVPVFWPNKKIFGTLCALDNKENHFSKTQEHLLKELKYSIERDLKFHLQYLELESAKKALLISNKKLEENNKKLGQRIKERTRHLKSTNDYLKEQNKKLEKANGELDKFVYSASHDLKAPLTSVQGLIELLKLDTQKGCGEKNSNLYLEMMEKSIFNLQGVIGDILNYAKNAREKLQLEKIPLREMVVEVINDLKFMKKVDKITFKIKIDPDFIITSDVNRLKVIFYNLISNAIIYHNLSPDNHPFIRIEAEKTKGKLLISVADNGQGIEQSQQGKIFQMFYRASINSNGSGLGLYIVKESVAKLKGKVSVNSVYGRGSTFIIELPQ
ncbi:sensor histidine kinase [Xanthovirga aplysinae]|uniref:sensor histidine kinase n=1 Tax=Xanthovirga aplysinae TaxID=2529853 RepID=UPI0012BD5695|nr:GAF domain-containing sensor histidine kinase [Xanthovirga aplysinae]MTI33517.1 GAF domain-containing sensor histidine kinase [Xanthovirga aplysinae]